MKRKNSDSTHYKYDMYNPRPVKRFKSRPATRSRTWGEFGKQAVGATAASAIGFIEGDFPGALQAGKGMYEYLAPDLKVEEVTQNNLIMSNYGGKFNTLPEGYGSLTAITSKFSANGIVLNRELYGIVQDPDCVYVGHNTYDPSFFAFGLACAIVRKVLKRAGYTSTSITEVIPMLSDTVAGPNSVYFSFTYTNTAGTIGTAAPYAFVAGSTIESCVNGSNLAATIESFYSVTTGDVSQQPFELETAYLRIGPGSGNINVLLSSINLKNENAEIFVYSSLTLQNRTVTSTQGFTTTEANDVQPLQGYRYLFNGAVPKSKQRDNSALSAASNQGLILTRAAELFPAATFKEPPLPVMFYNIGGSSKVKLAPGQMKKGILVHTYKASFNTLMRKLYSRNNSDGTGIMRVAPGKCELFALEEMMQTSSVYNVTVAYEKETRFCFELTTGKNPSILMNYASLQVDNLVPT